MGHLTHYEGTTLLVWGFEGIPSMLSWEDLDTDMVDAGGAKMFPLGMLPPSLWEMCTGSSWTAGRHNLDGSLESSLEQEGRLVSTSKRQSDTVWEVWEDLWLSERDFKTFIKSTNWEVDSITSFFYLLYYLTLERGGEDKIC
jgi:hypothetical protein